MTGKRITKYIFHHDIYQIDNAVLTSLAYARRSYIDQHYSSAITFIEDALRHAVKRSKIDAKRIKRSKVLHLRHNWTE